MIKLGSIKKPEKQEVYVIDRAPKRRILPRPARIALVVFTVLIVLMIAGGIGYTWFVGRNAPKEAPEPSKPAPQSLGVFGKPPKPSPDEPVGASVRFVTSPVQPGANASLDVHTTPGATCTIAVVYNEASSDSGLVEKKADDYGDVSWAWTVGRTVPPGEWPAKVTCKYGKKSGYVEARIEVKP